MSDGIMIHLFSGGNKRVFESVARWKQGCFVDGGQSRGFAFG